MLTFMLLAMLAVPPAATAPWTPPRNPDPHRILDEAEEDARQGRHAVALAKFLWFHRNALKHDPALYGVRLSFALSSWFELGQEYQPAMDALKKTRDDALRDFKRARGKEGEHPTDGPADAQSLLSFLGPAFESFHDFAAINETLGEASLTVSVFEELDREHPESARRLFDIAKEALVRAKAYALCGRYLRPDEDWLAAAQLYQMTRQSEEKFGAEVKEELEKSFTNKVATLLALLVVNGRRDEAEKIARKARLEWDSPAFHAAIDSALAGTVPEPWP